MDPFQMPYYKEDCHVVKAAANQQAELHWVAHGLLNCGQTNVLHPEQSIYSITD